MTINKKWKKEGLIFSPDTNVPWMRSHASLPTPLKLEGSRCRVYFSSRDARNRSHVGYFDMDLDDLARPVEVSSRPVLEPGPLGHFDDHGIYAASAVRDGGRVYLYTIGWNPGPTPPLFTAAIGLAVSEDGGVNFRKLSAAPIMGRSEHDPCLVTSPFVMKENDRWRMWYVSGYRWEETDKGLHSHYHIKYAESGDGVQWRRDGVVSLDHAVPEEKNIARTWVRKGDDGYEAWYSFDRGKGYRIGRAESEDGIQWQRKDENTGIAVSAEGWDAAAMAYPAVIGHEGRQFMFYNGNAFGKDGIGLAVMD